MNKLYGKFRGEVMDNRDSERRGRVLVRVPSIGKVDIGWAEACLPPNMFFIPKRGDFVWIEFEQGDIQRPVWVGIMPTSKYMRQLSPDYNTTRGVVKTDGSILIDSKVSIVIDGGQETTIYGESLNTNKDWNT